LTASEIRNLLDELVRIPSITESSSENDAALFIRDRLSELEYFSKNPQNLKYVPTHLEGRENLDLHAVIARVDALHPTKRTVLFISHFDVVDSHVFGDAEEHAFLPDKLAEALAKSDIGDRAGEDLSSEHYMFGRGCMDMKCGVAIEMALISEFANDRAKFDVNIIAVFVGDEENSAAGIRGAVPHIADFLDEGLEFIVAVNTEPCEAGRPGTESPIFFMGTMGKLLPSFYVLGKGAHVGNYYHSFPAALIASEIVVSAEGSADLADRCGEETPPSWACLELKLLKDCYTVTVPDRALVYFNAFAAKKMPRAVIGEMNQIALRALEKSAERERDSFRDMKSIGYMGDFVEHRNKRVMTYAELKETARENYGPEEFEAHMRDFTRSIESPDLRDRCVKILEEALRLSGLDGPLVITALFPPYLPSISTLGERDADKAVVSAAKRTAGFAKDNYDIDVQFVEFYAGLCDLSYIGFRGGMDDIDALRENMPGVDIIYSIPLENMMDMNIPVINIGPIGFDAHQRTERLELEYSLKILPKLLEKFISEF
jgi:arginine utilization protein RocB